MKTAPFLALLAAAFFTAAALAAEPLAVEKVDIARYMGQWHEIARLPMPYQDRCVGEVKAQYTLQSDRSVTVVNTCRDQDGRISRAEGLAKTADAGGGKLRVTFLPKGLRWLPVGRAPYWVLRLDPDYRHALVGTPNRKYLWILSRTPDMDAALLQSYIASAQEQGYDTGRLIYNPQ